MDTILDLYNQGYKTYDTHKFVEQWFNDSYIVTNKSSKPEGVLGKSLSIGKIYTFKYFADKSKNFYDLMPILLCFRIVPDGDGSLIFQGINISLIPEKYRVRVLDIIFKFYYNKGIKRSVEAVGEGIKPPGLQMDYKVISRILESHRTGYQLALSSYKMNKIIGSPMVVTYSDWWKLCFLKPKFIKGMNLSSLNYIYGLNKNNKQILSEAEIKAFDI